MSSSSSSSTQLTGPHCRPTPPTFPLWSWHPATGRLSACLSLLSGQRQCQYPAWTVSHCNLWPWMCQPSSALQSSCQQETQQDTSFRTFSPLLLFPLSSVIQWLFSAWHEHLTLLCWPDDEPLRSRYHTQGICFLTIRVSVHMCIYILSLSFCIYVSNSVMN